MKKRMVCVVFALLLVLPFVSARAFTWTITSFKDGSASSSSSPYPYWIAPLSEPVLVSQVSSFGQKYDRHCGTSFVIEFLREGNVVAIGRYEPPQSEWITTGCMPYGKGGFWHGPLKPWQNGTYQEPIVIDMFRARLCYQDGCGPWAGDVTIFQYRTPVGRKAFASSVSIQDVEKDIGMVSSLVQTAGATKAVVSTSTLGVLLWVGGVDDKAQTTTASFSAHVWACVDSDNNRQCDADQGASCLGAGGDWYRGSCCGVGVTGCAYDANVNAWCGRNAEDRWEWAPLDDAGEIHVLPCLNASLLSDGKALSSCGQAVSNTQPFGVFRNVTIGALTHVYSCSGQTVYECGGASGGFSHFNALGVGRTNPSLAEIYYCSSAGDWTKDIDSTDEATCSAAGFRWTGSRCCSEADDANEYYNDPSGTGGCWNKAFVPSGSFAVADRVLNYNGTFYGCRIIEDDLLRLQDARTNAWLINNSVLPCGTVLFDAQPGGRPHVVCQPNGKWQFTDESGGTINKSIAWAGLVDTSKISVSGCCAFEQCWNGTRCQTAGSDYRIGDSGFRCIL